MIERKRGTSPVYIDNDLAKLLKVEAAVQDTSMQDLAEKVLASYLLDQPYPVKPKSALERTIELLVKLGSRSPEQDPTALEIGGLTRSLKNKFFPRA